MALVLPKRAIQKKKKKKKKKKKEEEEKECYEIRLLEVC